MGVKPPKPENSPHLDRRFPLYLKIDFILKMDP
jgi:hypothetical protein